MRKSEVYVFMLREPDRRGGSENLKIPVEAVGSTNEWRPLARFRGVPRHQAGDLKPSH